MPFDNTNPETIAQRMLRNFGPNGENWTRGLWSGDNPAKTCLIGQFVQVTEGITPQTFMLNSQLPYRQAMAHPVFPLLYRACGGPDYPESDWVWCVNDQSESFENIRKILNKMHDLEMMEMVNAVR